MKKVFSIRSIYLKSLVLAATLMVSGCSFIPEKLILVNSEPGLSTSQTPGICISEKLYQAEVGPASFRNELNSNYITLLNWNIYKEKRENWSTDFLDLSEDQTIIVLQEAYLNQELHNLLSDKNLYWNLNTAFYLDGVETGVMTASTVKPIYNCGLRTTEPLIRTPKTTLISRFELSDSNEHLLVANIHGINFTIGADVYAQQINSLTNTLIKHRGPIIVAGDFNNWSNEKISVVNEMVEKLGLRTITYKKKNRVTVFGNTIDQIYYRQLELVAQNTIKVTSSDHNPIKATFRTVNN